MTILAVPNRQSYYIYDATKVYYGKHLGRSHKFLHSKCDPANYYLRCPDLNAYSAIVDLRAKTSTDKHILLDLLRKYHPELFI